MTLQKKQSRVRVGAATKCPDSLTLFSNKGRTGSRYVFIAVSGAESRIESKNELKQQHPVLTGLRRCWQDASTVRGTVQAALFVFESC